LALQHLTLSITLKQIWLDDVGKTTNDT